MKSRSLHLQSTIRYFILREFSLPVHLRRERLAGMQMTANPIATAVLTLCVALAVAVQVRAGEPPAGQEATVQALEKLGGLIIRDEKAPGKPVIEVRFMEEVRLPDEAFKHLQALPKLTSLSLGRSEVNTAWMAQLAGLTNLRSLHLTDQETDAALLHIGKMTRLQSLRV